MPGILCSAIVKLGKPYDRGKINAAKDVVASYLRHEDSWVRHEALWFLVSWGKLAEHKASAIDALLHDPWVDNRGYAALCLANVCAHQRDLEAIRVLKNVIENEHEDKLVRLDAYGALLEIAASDFGTSFYAGEKDLADINWKWVASLPS